MPGRGGGGGVTRGGGVGGRASRELASAAAATSIRGGAVPRRGVPQGASLGGVARGENVRDRRRTAVPHPVPRPVRFGGAATTPEATPPTTAERATTSSSRPRPMTLLGLRGR